MMRTLKIRQDEDTNEFVIIEEIELGRRSTPVAAGIY
jgi:hypothetical protein